MAEEGKKPNEQNLPIPPEGLQDPSNGVTIPPADNKPNGAGEDPEDTLRKYQETIVAQQKQIGTLLDQVNSLNDQIVTYVRSTGAKVEGNEPPDDAAQKRTFDDDYVYLKDLGKEIGKGRHN